MEEKKALSKRFTMALETLIEAGYVKNKRRFAEACGVTQQKLSEILKGRMNAGIDVLQGMLSKYPVRAEYLFENKKPILKTSYRNNTSPEIAAEPESGYRTQQNNSEGLYEDEVYLELMRENSRLKDKIIKLMEEIERLKSGKG